MGSRRAVGATIAAVLLFSSLLLSNLVLVDSQQERVKLILIAENENTVFAEATTLGSVALLNVLDEIQLAISSAVLPCSTLGSALATLVERSSFELRTSDGISVNASAIVANDGVALDNLSTLNPFAGSIPGYLSMRATMSVHCILDAGTISYQKKETHHLFIPVDLNAPPEVCMSSVSEVEDGFRSLGPNECNSTVVQEFMARVAVQISSGAKGRGLEALLFYSLIPGASRCTLDFNVRVTEPDVAGPLGDFDWSVGQSVSLLVWSGTLLSGS